MRTEAVLISGTSGGIGTATAERFLGAGFDVLGLDLVEGSIAHPGFRMEITDVRDAAAVVDAVETFAENRSIMHVACLAGGAVLDKPEPAPEDSAAQAAEAFASLVELNLTGQFNVVRASLPALERSEGDRSVALCSSINALAGFGAPGYSAAKAGVIGMMHALAGPLGALGIRINTVAPGTTRTPAAEADAAAASDTDRFERAARGTHLGKVGRPEDVAAAIQSIATGMPHVTDELVRVDGGQLLARGPGD